MFIEKWKIIAVAVFSLLLVEVFFLGVKPDEFIFSHDELLTINYFDTISGLYTRAFQDLNVENVTILSVTLVDRLYYFLGYTLHINLLTLQKTLYFIKLFISILISYIGFKKFSQILERDEKNKISDYVIWLVTFLYAFNTYTIIYWHGNAFELNLLLCYSFAPLALYYFDVIINNPWPKITLLVKEALIFLLISFSVYFFAVFIIILFVYYVANSITSPKVIKPGLINLLKLGLLCLPLFVIFVPMLQVIIYGSDTVNATGGETFANLQGGLLYPLFFWFSWGIYTDWAPKNIFIFNYYLKSFLYLLSPLAIYVTIFIGLSKKTFSKKIINFLLIFLVALIFVKGSQPPFQEAFLQLMKHFPPFRVFRSPDNKFGFGIILSICFLLLYISNTFKKGLFVGIMLFIVLIQAYPLFSGIAIRGENTSISSDRVIHIPDDYKELADYINNTETSSEYIMSIPPISFGHYIFSSTEKHLGQDLMPKLVQNPFVTPNEYSGMSTNTYSKINDALENNLIGIKSFPIKYFLIRKDLEFVTENSNLDLNKNPEMVKVFENSSFALFKNIHAANLIQAENVDDISFKVISPVEYKVHITGIRENSELILNTNFNRRWKVYIEGIADAVTDTNEGKFSYYPNRKNTEVNLVNTLHNNYSNEWNINKSDLTNNFNKDFYKLNVDGTVDAYFTIFYQPQTNFYLLASITIISALIYATFILVKHNE